MEVFTKSPDRPSTRKLRSPLIFDLRSDIALTTTAPLVNNTKCPALGGSCAKSRQYAGSLIGCRLLALEIAVLRLVGLAVPARLLSVNHIGLHLRAFVGAGLPCNLHLYRLL